MSASRLPVISGGTGFVTPLPAHGMSLSESGFTAGRICAGARGGGDDPVLHVIHVHGISGLRTGRMDAVGRVAHVSLPTPVSLGGRRNIPEARLLAGTDALMRSLPGEGRTGTVRGARSGAKAAHQRGLCDAIAVAHATATVKNDMSGSSYVTGNVYPPGTHRGEPSLPAIGRRRHRKTLSVVAGQASAIR